MKTIVLVTSMLTLAACEMAYSPPEGDVATAMPQPATSPEADVATAAPRPPTPPETSAVVSTWPLRASTPEECVACHGEWGIHGLSETESCNCRTSDAGKRCTDGNDCQGLCIADESNPEYELAACSAGYGFLVGRCSAFAGVFGCWAFIADGARDEGPVSIAEPPSVICAD